MVLQYETWLLLVWFLYRVSDDDDDDDAVYVTEVETLRKMDLCLIPVVKGVKIETCFKKFYLKMQQLK